MFESLTESLSGIFRILRSRGRLTEDNISEGMRRVRTALLEADVNYKVARDFVESVKQRAIGQDVLKSVSPAQQVIKIVHDELVNLMGPAGNRLTKSSEPPTVIMVAGLQGSGKTSTCAKLAVHLKKKGDRVILVAADLKRPAAVQQLRVLGEQAGVEVYAEDAANAVGVAQRSVSHARQHALDWVILDTAGRLQIDERMMSELKDIARAVRPRHIFLVADSMTGQEAVSIAKEFDEKLELTGIILTKLDGDARGGAALSVKAVTGKPIWFVTVSERLEGLEEFHPDRMASRILGMGDVVGLVEKAQEMVDAEQAAALQQKLRKETLSLQDFYQQLQQIKRMGPLASLIEKIPGIGQKIPKDQIQEDELDRVEAIIQSMTPQERQQPEMIDSSRRHRIARGSGTEPAEVSQFIKQFLMMRKMMKRAALAGSIGEMKITLPGGLTPRHPRQKRRHRRR